MRDYLWFILLLTVGYSPITLLAQNLVANPSFETATSCPNERGQISNAEGWFAPNNGTSDYYHACGSDSWSPGDNDYGYQQASTGEAFAGIRTYSTDDRHSPEYISSQLTSTLEAGKNYTISFKVSLADGEEIGYATDDIGLYLSNNSPTNGNYFSFTPQVENQENMIIANTNSWTTISGCYRATGGERYLTIGNFKSEQNTTAVIIPKYDWSSMSYYYVDDVVIEEISESPVDLGPDRTLCANESALLSAAVNNATYLWNTGSTTSTILIETEGNYSVEVKQDNCVFTDDASILLQEPPVFDISPDRTVCDGDSITFSTGLTGVEHLWSTQSTENNTTVFTSQSVWVKVTDNYCEVIDFAEATVLRIPEVDLGPDATLCFGQEHIWNLDDTQVAIIWQDGDDEKNYIATQSGEYHVTMTNECGIAQDTVLLSYHSLETVTPPNIITPNGDGKNETFNIDLNEPCTWVLNIYNRWGGLIYSKTDYQNEWPLSSPGVGVYFYEVTTLENEQQLKGWVQVLE